MNMVTININGMEYRLKGEESIEYLNDIAKEVDEKIREMILTNRGLTISSAAVLCSINFCDQVRKEKKSYVELNEEIDKYNLKINNLISENTDLQNRINNIENRINQLQIENGKLEEEVEAYNILITADKEKIFGDSTEIQELENEIEILRETLKKITNENRELEEKINI